MEIGSFFIDKGDNYRYNNRYVVCFCGGGQNMENIGEKIMQARKTKGMTQDTLAQLVNVSRQTVSHWENGVSHS